MGSGTGGLALVVGHLAVIRAGGQPECDSLMTEGVGVWAADWMVCI